MGRPQITSRSSAKSRVYQIHLPRAEYEFQCRMRNPLCEDELRSFLVQYPIFYEISTCPPGGNIGAFKKAEQEWVQFAKENRYYLAKVKTNGLISIYRLTPKGSPVWQLVELHAEVLTRIETLNRWVVEGPAEDPPLFGRQLSTHCHMAGPVPNRVYFDLVSGTEKQMLELSNQFKGKWKFFPGSLRLQWRPLIVWRNEVIKQDFAPRVFIPIEASTTLEEVQNRWSEVTSCQKLLCGAKKRPKATPYGDLLSVYDKKKEGEKITDIAEQVGKSPSAVQKLLNRVGKDVHGESWSTVKRTEKFQKPGPRTRMHQLCSQLASACGGDALLERAALELKIPKEKLDTPNSLTAEESRLFRDWLEESGKTRLRGK